MTETEEHPWKGARYAFAWLKPELVGTKGHSGWSIAMIDPDAATLLHPPTFRMTYWGNTFASPCGKACPGRKRRQEAC